MSPLDQPQLTLPDIWASHAKWRSDQTAVVVGRQRLTWAEFNGRLNRVATSLLSLGLEKGDKVGLLMTNSPEMLEIMLGTIKAGLVAVPLSTLVTAETVQLLLADSESRALFVSAGLRHLVEDQLAALDGVRQGARFAIGFSGDGFRDYDAFVSTGRSDEPLVDRSPDDAAVIIYSSGTTGAPKGIVHTLRNRQNLGYTIALELRIHERSVVFSTVSLTSNGAWVMLMPALLLGATLVVMEKFSAPDFLDLVQRERVTHTFVVPSQLIAILATPELESADVSSLCCVFSAGSVLRPDVREATIQRISSQLYELYGLTEGAATFIKPEDLATKAGTVGRPMLGCDIAILDGEDRLAPAGTPGEIIGYGMHLMQGYYRNPELTEAAIWRDGQGRTWLRTGDIGVLDADGFLTILDRKKDMIISGGLNVYPSDIEEVIGSHPDVLDVSVIGVPHDKWGEAPVALVIRQADATLSAEEVRAWANAHLAKHQRLFALEFRESFPRNALGKVLKRELRATYAPSAPAT